MLISPKVSTRQLCTSTSSHVCTRAQMGLRSRFIEHYALQRAFASRPLTCPRCCPCLSLRMPNTGAKAFAMFQGEMRTLLNEMKARGPPPEEDQDIAAQLYRVS